MAATVYTADVVLLTPAREVLLIQRGDWEPHPYWWALPGGHVDLADGHLNPDRPPPEKAVRHAGARELFEETGIRTNPADLRKAGVYADPGRDPRGRYVTGVYTATIPSPDTPVPGDDAYDAHWWPLGDLPERLAFDHARILSDVVASVWPTTPHTH